jgi:phage repressor protein C with HTH and peptisase S24 domain
MNSIVTQRFIKCHDKLREENRVRSSRQFAISLDYLPQSLSEILKGRRDVTIDLLRKAVEKYKVNPVFLYTGEGPLFMSEEDHRDFRVLTIVTNVQEDERIVHVPLPAQAGYPGELSQPNFIQNLPTYTLPDYKYKVGTHRSFDVAGDSMEPLLYEGDKVICNFLEPTLWESGIKDNYVYVVVTRSDVAVKRVINHLNKKRQLQLISDNESYESYFINFNDIREIWQVRAKICPFFPASPAPKQNVHDDVRELRQVINDQSKIIGNLNQTIERLLNQK